MPIDPNLSPPESPLTYQVAPAFVRYASATWTDSHTARVAVFESFERGALALGLTAEHIAIGMSYWLALMAQPDDSAWIEGAGAPAHAAALFIAVEQQHTSSPVGHESAAIAFTLSHTQLGTLPAIVDALEPLVAGIPVKDAIAHLRAVHAFEETNEAVLAQRRFEQLWQTPPHTRALADLTVADFGMILELVDVDDIMARSLPYIQTPTHLLLASSDRHDQPLATLPWFGPMDPEQWLDALRTLLTVASIKPDGLAPARPLILFVPTQDDVEALLVTPGLEGMAIATHAALAQHMESLKSVKKKGSRRKPKRRSRKK